QPAVPERPPSPVMTSTPHGHTHTELPRRGHRHGNLRTGTRPHDQSRPCGHRAVPERRRAHVRTIARAKYPISPQPLPKTTPQLINRFRRTHGVTPIIVEVMNVRRWCILRGGGQGVTLAAM